MTAVALPSVARLRPAGGRGRIVLSLAVASCALALVARVFAGVNWPATLHALSGMGPRALLALVPFAASMCFDALGMLSLVRVIGHAVPLWRLFLLRVATEALHMTAPAGFLVADSATIACLDASNRVPVASGATLMLARKWLVTRAHAAYIVLGSTLGAATLVVMSERIGAGRWLPWVAGTSAIVPLSISAILGIGFGGASVFVRVCAALDRVEWAALRKRLQRWRGAATSLDERLARVGAERGSIWTATLSFLGCWLFESVETALIAALVGGHFDLRAALAVETGASLLRSIANFAPAGLGVQDLGYASLMPLAGLDLQGTALFLLLKRGKDFFWIVVGYCLLGSMRNPGRDPRSRYSMTAGTSLSPHTS